MHDAIILADTGGDVPLASKHFEYPYLPQKADSGDGPRGTQQGKPEWFCTNMRCF